MKQNERSIDAALVPFDASSQGPFHNMHDIHLFYGGANRGEIVRRIVDSACQGNDILHVHGESGSGKTMLSLVVADRLKHRYRAIRYDYPEISATRLLRFLLMELCAPQHCLITRAQARNGASRSIVNAAIAKIESCLSHPESIGRSNQPYVFIIDCNKQLDAETLRVLDKLNEIQQGQQRQLLSIVLQPASTSAKSHAINADGIFQSGNHFWLRRLTLSETHEYLRHHMMLFDYNSAELFTVEMAYLVASRTEGVFRAINSLVKSALIAAKRDGKNQLSMSHLLMAGRTPQTEVATDSHFLARYGLVLFAFVSVCVVASTTAAMITLL